jgi:PRTRC genetic system protein C
MPLEVTNLKRKFSFKTDGKTVALIDPNAEMTVQEVLQLYSGQYPELTTCTVDGPKIDGDAAVYEFKTTVGTKG